MTCRVFELSGTFRFRLTLEKTGAQVQIVQHTMAQPVADTAGFFDFLGTSNKESQDASKQVSRSFQLPKLDRSCDQVHTPCVAVSFPRCMLAALAHACT